MRRKQKIWITSVLTILFIFVVGVCVKTSVFGRFTPEEPYVTDAPMGTSSSLTTVTNEGGNQKGSLGSGAAPMDGVPVAELDEPKGSEKNPFVLLEIVPELEQQQMVYLNTSDENYPLDVMQIGIDASAKKNANFHNQRQSIGNYDEIKAIGHWFYEYQYDLYEYGEDEQTIKKPLVEISELYSMKMEPDYLKEKGINVQEFDSYFNSEDKCHDVKSLSEKYPALFQKDGSGEEIRDIALEDNRNWDAKREKKGAVHFDVSFFSDKMNTDKDYRNYVNVPEIIRENPHIFKTDNNGNEISDAVREDINNWKGECKGTDSYDYRVLTKSITKDDYNAYQNKEITMKDLISRYPDLFQTDVSGKKIEKSRLSADGWKLEKLDDGKFPTVLDSGYLHYVGSGGNYTFSTEEKWNNGINSSVLALEKKENGEWEYFEDLPDNAKKGDAYWQFTQNPQNQELYWSVPMVAQGYGLSRKVVLLEEVDENEGVYVFTYKRDISRYEFSYDGGETHTVYSFKYYGLKTNDILKRSLFTFQDEEECKNFNLRVIAMTPSEINKAVQGDTPETLDIIERADMFYIASYSKEKDTDNIKQVYELYNKYIAKKDGYVYSEDNIKSFYENDLDWGSCYKILSRLSTNSNLPLLWTQDVGTMINNGVDGTENTHMYVTEDVTANHIHAKGSLNNLAKLYLITIQFDLLARKGEGEIEYKRTFSEDILPNLQTILLNSSAMEKADKDTASTTGYYERKLVETSCNDGTVLTDDAKKTCYYLWNLWTFYPSDIKLSSGNQKEQSNDVYVQYGYLDSFFDSNADVFHDGVADHHSGSDGYDGKNVGVVHGDSNSDVNHSTLIGNAESAGIVNTTMNVAYQIMNKQTPKIEPLNVRVEKRKKDYQKLSNELILIDYDKKADYDTAGKEPLYIKLKITNTNNEDAILKSIKLLKDEADSDTITLVPRKTKEESTKMTKEMIRDVNGKQPVEGYRIPANGSLTFYVPYQISEYKQDYTTLQLVTQARKFLIRKGKKESTLGGPVEHTVTISERTLFNLE